MVKEFLLLFVLAGALLVAGAVLAEKEQGIEVIDGDSVIMVEIDNTEGGPNINIEYDIRVRNGTRVNVWFLDEDEFGNYAQGLDFYYYVVWSQESTRNVQKDWTWDERGVFYVVIDAMGLAGENETSEVQYRVEWSEAKVSNWLDHIGYCFAAGVLILVAFLFLASMYYKAKGRRSPETPGEAGPPVDDAPPPDGAGTPEGPPPSPEGTTTSNGLPEVREPSPPAEAPPYGEEGPGRPPA
jgi:hypothetical protein